MKVDLIFWIQTFVILVLGTLGALLFQLGVNQFGTIEIWNFRVWFNFVITPAIFTGLFFLMISRLLFSLPLTKMGIGRFSALITSLNVMAIAISSAIIFKEAFSIKHVIGVVLSFIAIILIGTE